MYPDTVSDSNPHRNMKLLAAAAITATVLLLASTQNPTTKVADTWAKAGVVGVDSGQLLMIDPCYLEQEWVREGGGKDWKVSFWGRDEDKITKVFGASPLKRKDQAECEALRKRIAQHCSKERLLVLTSTESGSSYDKCGELTMSALGYGQLKYRAGHAGLGVAASTGQGDGVYPVYVRKNDKGVIVEMRVLFAEGDEANKLKSLIERQKRAKQGK